MNLLERKKKENENWRKYHVPGCPNCYTLKKDAVFISVANSLEHEIAKLKVCYDLKKTGCNFITEAVENKTGKRRDVVDLSSGMVYEIELNKKRAERFKNNENVIVIKLWKEK